MQLLSGLLEIYVILIIIRVVLSWVRPYPHSAIEGALYQITEPVLGAVRRVIPPIGGGLDISPIIVIVAISLIRQLLLR
jgi:YggT family protein